MTGIRAVRVTTAGARKAAVRVEYDDGSAKAILADQLLMPSPLEPAAATIQVANQLKKLTVAPQGIEPNQIIIEWTPAKAERSVTDDLVPGVQFRASEPDHAPQTLLRE
jgi:hypothetical protein